MTELSDSSNGSATPMRGKSPTCRQAHLFSFPRSETAAFYEKHHGKSETCRASEWQSHN
jgi:hypothetical protein